MGPVWGIDLGGTKIEGIILDSKEDPEVLKRTRIPTEAHLGYDHILGQISRLIEVLTAETGLKPSSVGIGTPGVLDPTTRTMKNANSTALNGMPLKRDIELALGLPVSMANDANCFAVAETHLGIVSEKAPDARVVFGAILGTGVGGGIVVDGKPLYGRHGIAGEWGHNFLDESGGECYCGKIGCIETILAGPSLEKYYHSLTNTKLPMKKILERYKDPEVEDVIANKTIFRMLHFFGKAMSQIINVLDPDVIVLGGGLSNIDLLYTEGIKEVEKHVFNHSLETTFLRPKLGDSAGVFGAALL